MWKVPVKGLERESAAQAGVGADAGTNWVGVTTWNRYKTSVMSDADDASNAIV